MADSENASSPTSTTAGVLWPDEPARHVELTRMACGPGPAPWVENYWMLRWRLPPGVIHRSSTLPHPSCTLSVERGHLREGVAEIGGPVVVTGVLTRRFDVTVRDSGWVLGVKFRPGGFAGFTGTSARSLRDVPAAAPGAFPPATVSALAQLGPHVSPDECRVAVDTALDCGGRRPERDYLTVVDIITVTLEDRCLVRAGQVEERCGIGTRRLQRLVGHYIGATPKWVLARYRIHDAASDLDAGCAGTLADLAARYGWFDQAHFTREFTRLIGVSPGAYRG